MKNYKTITKDGVNEIEIKKSRFIAHLKRVENEEEAQDFIDQIKKEHSKATHNCSAYTIGENDEIQRAHDDGEPSGTAGYPMLEIFLKKELKNVAAVVTRYFGGIKLGAGGLIRAYAGAVNEAIDEIGIVERQLLQQIFIEVDYTVSGKLQNMLENSTYILQNIEYTDKVTFECFAKLEEVDQFKAECIELLNNKLTISDGDEAFIEVKI